MRYPFGELASRRCLHSPQSLGLGTLSSVRLAVLIQASVAGLACGSVGPSDDQNNNVPIICTAGSHRCQGVDYEVCEGGTTWAVEEHCAGTIPHCTPEGGCGPCEAGIPYCDGNSVRVCGEDGTPGDVVETCDEAADCIGGVCVDPCEVAAESRSYIGCEYWPTSTINYEMPNEFDTNFGVVVHNATAKVAHVSITRNQVPVAEADVLPGQLHTFELPFVQALRDAVQSVKLVGTAYRLRSTQPVTAYQFNPLDWGILSQSNDASLLLPTHSLSTNYMVLAWQTHGVSPGQAGFQFRSGFIAIVGIQEYSEVTLTYSAHTLGGDVAAATPGTETTYMLQQGEVLQVLSARPGGCSGTVASDDCNGMGQGSACDYCDMGPEYDLTGTTIRSSAPVAVFAGHQCTFVPFNYWACDHLEEQLMPLETWGKEIVVGRTAPQAKPPYAEEPNVVRILSGADDNLITLDPAQSGVGDATVLDKGAYIELTTTEDLRVQATAAISVGQYLVSHGMYQPPDMDCSLDSRGDPAFALMVPVEQYRSQYSFLAPASFPYNYVNVTKRVHAGGPVVYLDGVAIPDSAFGLPVGGSTWGVARLPIEGTGHVIESDQPFGIVVYGLACYVSYSYPGGLDLHAINLVE